MKRFLDYSYPYGDKSIKELRNRNQQYDRRSQHISIACTPRLGHHVPFLVKLPSFTSWFARLPNAKYFDKYRGGSPGVFNGLYYFPDGKEENEMKVPDVIAKPPSTQNLTETFKQSPKYELLTYMGKRVFDNIDIQRHGYIDVKLDPADFRNSQDLLQKSKSVKLNLCKFQTIIFIFK